MRITVTGGAGFIGGHLLKALLESGNHELVVLDNLRTRRPLAAGLARAVEFRRHDIRDPDALHKALRGCEVVYHLAAQSNVAGSLEDPDYSFASNVAGTYNVLRAASQAGLRRVVFTSSREVYGEPEVLPAGESAPLRPSSPYGASKAAGEMYCQFYARESEVTVVRLANVYGAGDCGRVIPLFIENALRGDPLVVYGGGQLLDFVAVATVVRALVRIGLGPFVAGPLNIGSGTGTTLQDLGNRIVAAAGSRSRVTIGPRRPCEVMRYVADIGRAQAAIGLERPADPLWQLPECIEWARGALERAA